MHKILVAGCGNFGAWWVVGLLRNSSIDSITIYDPFFNALSLIESRICLFPELNKSWALKLKSQGPWNFHGPEAEILGSEAKILGSMEFPWS